MASMRASHLAWIGAVLLSLSSSIAMAQRPRADEDPLNRIRPGSPARPCSCRTMDANATTYPFVYSVNISGQPRPIVVGWETNVVVSCSDTATLCWSTTSSAGIGSQITNQRGYLTDCASSWAACAGTSISNSGDGNCFTIGGGGSWTTHPDFEDTYGVVGMVTTSTTVGGYLPYLCSGPQKPHFPMGSNVRPFCRQNLDCTEAGVEGGTCLTTNTDDFKNRYKKGQGGAMLLGKALNADTRCCACPER